MVLRDSERTGEKTIHLAKGEKFPSFGFSPKVCPHPLQYSVFAEWESDDLGHGWFCALCGTVNQVG